VTGLLDGLARVVTGRRTAWAVIAGWVLLLALAVPLAAGLGTVQRTDPVLYLPAGAQSTELLRELSALPGGDNSTAVVVYAHPGGLTPADQARIAETRAAVPAAVTSAGPPSPIQLSADGAAALFTVALPSKDTVLDVAVPQLRRLTTTGSTSPTASAAADVAGGRDGSKSGGLSVAVTGPAGYTADANTAAAGIDGRLLATAAAVVVVLLLIIYRSPVLWLLPMLAVSAGLLIAQAVITALARAGALTVTDLAAGILNVLVFGAATDYALLLIARYREQLHTTTDHRQALAAAVRGATPAILASGGTVIAGLLCLLAATTPSIRGLGPVAALGVAGGLIAGLTLLPALLAVTGRRAFWPRTPRPAADRNQSPTAPAPAATAGGWVRLGTLIARRPRLVWMLTALVLAGGALGLLDTRLGLSQAGTFRSAVPAVTGQRLLDAHFPPGASAPAQILTDTTTTGAAQQTAATTPGVLAVTPTTHVGSRTLLQATLAAPPDSPAAQHTITDLRTQLAAIPGARSLVGGTSAAQLDTARGAAHDRVVMPLVLGVVLLVLIVLLRALVASPILLATVVLSYAAALGVSVQLFHALGLAGTDPAVPLYAFLFLVSLGVDYNIFLMTRVRDETLQHGTHTGTLRGLALTGGVITSAGLVLAATFTTLAVLPLVVLTETGLAVALGVLLDTFLVRSLLVPALTLDLDRHTWWPSTLAHPTSTPRKRQPDARQHAVN